MKPTPLQKLRVFAPQWMMFAACDAGIAISCWVDKVHPVASLQAAIVGMTMGVLCVITAGVKAMSISDYGWDEHIPDKPSACLRCASIAADHRKALAEVAELREALATLRIE